MYGSSCLSFALHMYGSAMGDLNVYTRRQDGEVTLEKPFMGNQGDQWNLIEINLNYDIMGEEIQVLRKKLHLNSKPLKL